MYESNKFLEIISRKLAIRREAKWRWLAENQEDIFFILVTKNEYDSDMVLFLDYHGKLIFYENWSHYNRVAKCLKNKLKRFGIDYKDKLYIDI